MFSDFFIVLYWWLILLFLGSLALPVTFKLFARFWDKGWIFSKTLAVIIFSYLLFVSGRFHFFPFVRETILLFLVLALTAGVWFLSRKGEKKKFIQTLKRNRRTFIFEEGLFFVALMLWSFVRGLQPRIEGLEKFMDFGFVNSILRSTWFPPVDMWFAGEPINYYFFGHLQGAFLTKLSGLDPAVVYNLLIATIFALTLTSAFCLASNLIYFLKKKGKRVGRVVIVGGLISALLLSLGGNLHSAIYLVKEGPGKYWYPDATRFIGYNPNNPEDKTIHEFPVYSFVVADLHGHMNDIPAVLLFLALLLVFGRSFWKKRKHQAWDWWPGLLSLSFLLAVMYMTNSWDFLIYGAFSGIFLVVVFAFLGFGRRKFSTANYLVALVKKLASFTLPLLLAAVIFSLPFSLTFSPMAEGIRAVMARSLWWQLLVLWGFFWFVAVSFWLFIAWRWREDKKSITISDLFVISATIWATVLIIIPEFIYVKDIYIPEYHRANTMFKLVYQSFIIYSLVGGYVFIRLKEYWWERKQLLVGVAFSLLFLIGFGAQMVYPVLAVKGYYGKLLPSNYKGLFGMNFLKDRYPSDYQGVIWLQKNVVGQPVVLEAVGDSYTFYNRVSAMTGLPTIEGWLVHEWLWRGGYDQPGARAADVEAIYQSEDEQKANRLLNSYLVEYVFIGDLEKEKYPRLKEERFKRWGETVFSSGGTKIYQVKRK